jgi:response regulator RpfG family c-di-GMP phosphodiesterase
MEPDLAVAQAVKYAEELRVLYAQEREQRRSAEQALARLQESYAMTVRGLAAALELRDDATGAHAERVTTIALGLARSVAPELAADPQLEYAFLLHDLGKIGIRDAILLKPGPLTPDERRTMEQHPLLGQGILEHAPHLGDVVREV